MPAMSFTMSRFRTGKIFVLLLALSVIVYLLIVFSERDSLSTRVLITRKMADTRSGDNLARATNKTTLTSSSQRDNSSSGSANVHVSRDQGNATSQKDSTYECTFPDIDPFDPAVIAVTDFFPPVSCEGGVPHLVYVTGDTIKVNHSRTSLVGDQNNRFKDCRYRSIAKQPGSDFQTIVLYNSPSFNDSITLRDSDDNLVVECYGSNNTVLSRSYFSLIREKKDLEVKLEENIKKHIAINSPKEIFNVLLVGIEGNSKQNFQRHMPKARNYLLNVLNAFELHKYNKVGDHTYPNVIPILTGKTENELDRHNWTWREHFDYVNDEFVWSDFSRAGYRTGLYLDSIRITAFHYEKMGWDKPPVDYYYRASLLKQQRDKLMRHNSPNCVGEIPELTYNTNFWIQMASTFNNSKTQPFFGYSFYNHLTHEDPNGASAGDDLYLRFFVQLKEKNIINNTIIIFFSDHGARLGNIRLTYNGMIESMTPHVFLVFPPWFQRKYPDVMKVLKINQDRLTTNKDLHATLLDILNFQGKPGIGDIKQKGISLFNEIPRERTCDDAGIGLQFCVCNKFTRGNVSSAMTFALAKAVKDKLRYYIRNELERCVELSVKSVENVMNIQLDSDKKTEGTSLYHITVTTTPGGALYEAKLSVNNFTNVITVIDDVIRLNKYRGQDWCMRNPKLKPYCYCGIYRTTIFVANPVGVVTVKTQMVTSPH